MKSLRNFLFFFLFCSFQSPEKTLSSLSVAEKIGQLFVIPACPKRDTNHLADLEYLLHEYHVGGIILKQGNLQEYRALMNHLNKHSSLPLLYYADAEWGLGMRMENTISFPKNLTLGHISDDALITDLGQEIGRQCRSLGIHVNLAPIVDINTNPLNPIIGERSFGDHPLLVAKKGVAFFLGLQKSHVMACAKHFPGHGDTTTDSHLTLPVIAHDRSRIETVELVPFKAMIAHNVPFIMTAHLYVPALSQEPCTFSREVVTDLLKKNLGFKGLVITDALNMKALSERYSPKEIAVRAFLAGHDQLLYGDHIAPNIDDILRRQIPEAYKALMQAYQEKKFSSQELDDCVLKILKIKAMLLPPTYEILNTEEAYLLKEKLTQAAQTILR